MTEPETMSYTISHFNNQPSGTQMRNMIFEKYAGIAKPWIISDSIISYFEIDKASAKDNAKKWWESDGSFIPTQTGPAAENLDSTLFQSVKDYAILEAGRSKVKLAS